MAWKMNCGAAFVTDSWLIHAAHLPIKHFHQHDRHTEKLAKYLLTSHWLAIGFFTVCHCISLLYWLNWTFICLRTHLWVSLVHRRRNRFQIHRQFPQSFEYNEYFLKFLAYHYVSNRFRTFMLDNEFERMEAGWLMEDGGHSQADSTVFRSFKLFS